MTTEELKNIATQVRRDIIRMVHSSASGHPGGSLGCADFMTALYFHIMDIHRPFHMNGKGEDVFILSNGHISPVYYSVLARAGFFELDELASFRQINSRLQGHPAVKEGLPGVRIATGSLGQGMSAALGIALGKKLDDDENLVYVLTGDGELDEGQNWEAAMFAAHHKVDNCIAVVDHNGQQIDGPTQEVMHLNPLAAKWESFGWKVFHMNGNDMEDIIKVMKEAKNACGQAQPIVVLMKTEMGYGVDFMQGTHKWHGKAPNDEQTKIALDQLP